MADSRTFEQEGRAVAGNHRAMWGTCKESLHLNLSNTVNRRNTETIGKHGEVVEIPPYKFISEGLAHVAAWYHRTLDQSS